jgi:hypothetical protein
MPTVHMLISSREPEQLSLHPLKFKHSPYRTCAIAYSDSMCTEVIHVDLLLRADD